MRPYLHATDTGLTARVLVRGSRALPRTVVRWKGTDDPVPHVTHHLHLEAPSDVGPELSAEQRGEEILAVFDTAFGELLAADPARSA